ncbi:histone-like nucleoid-structuring protein Lsr2 [Amycolatopsis sp. lyj-23]|uniref:histone-like nucleoid-structuring protein Lsr2 n=1 Tax=Amycolatopsis sp. lyj-23 TaxID=2789283 RepID=UPI00397D758D
MAQRVAVEVLCDIDGSEGAAPVDFGLDGVEYTIDLSEENAAALRDELARYVAAARRVGGRKNRGTGAAKPPQRNGEASEARAWAQENGIAVAAIGRVSAEVLEQYRASKAESEPKLSRPAARKRTPRKTAAARK